MVVSATCRASSLLGILRAMNSSIVLPYRNLPYRNSVCLLLCWQLLFFSFALGQRLDADEGSSTFRRSIAPILADKCIHCHGPDEAKREAELRLDIATNDSVQRTALERNLIERITSTDPDLQMPPPDSGKTLSDGERQKLKDWVAAGAKFESHWAFQPIDSRAGHEPVELAPVSQQVIPAADKVASESAELSAAIDKLVQQGYETKGLLPAPQITNSQWLRRAYIDLVGIPPTWEECEAFESDQSADAKRTVVDRLLESKAYGQRWGKYWLDLARYADTHGGAAIGFTSFPFSYTYRDYVIQAFNDDRPYDQFIREQIAADQLDYEPHDPRLAGLGFLTVGMQFRNRHDTVDDQIDVVTRGLMGLTVTCARCHDHKFDPIPTRDYYSIYAALTPSNAPSELPVIEDGSEAHANAEQREAYFTQLESLKIQYAEMARDQIEVMKQRLRMQVGLYLRELVNGLPEQDVATAFLSYRTDDIRPLVYNRWKSYIAGFAANDAVFGPWHQLSKLPSEGFAAAAKSLVETFAKEIPDAAKAAQYHALGATAPKWNPLVVEALKAKPLESMLDVANAYGELFTRVNQEWSQALQAASQEAVSSQAIIPDDDARHLVINSPVYRQLRRHLYGKDSPTELPDEVASQLLNRTISDSLNGKKGAIHAHHLNAPGSVPRAMTLKEPSEEQESFVFLRGNHMALGEKVRPGFLSAITRGETQFKYRPGQRRLALAQAIVAPENPLTRRVIVNWIWQQHFGQGLVRSTDDFGTRGTPPSNPALLDYLATKFLEDGWSIKQMHRRIMLSETYQLASVEVDESRVVDPENDHLWRMPRRRLDFESMRDSMLSVAGELDSSLGGRPIDLANNPSSTRRTVYGFVNRDIVSNLSSTFDSANPNACTLKRPDTLVPQQTLFALNSEFIQQRAAKLAKLVLAEPHEEDRARVDWLYRKVFSRSPTADEMAIASAFVKAPLLDSAVTQAETSSASVPSASGASATGSTANATGSSTTTAEKEAEQIARRWSSLAHAMLASNEFSFVD